MSDLDTPHPCMSCGGTTPSFQVRGTGPDLLVICYKCVAKATKWIVGQAEEAEAKCRSCAFFHHSNRDRLGCHSCSNRWNRPTQEPAVKKETL